jgi:hypothetical protein
MLSSYAQTTPEIIKPCYPTMHIRATPTACNFAALRKFFQVPVSTGTQTIQGLHLQLNDGTVPYIRPRPPSVTSSPMRYLE